MNMYFNIGNWWHWAWSGGVRSLVFAKDISVELLSINNAPCLWTNTSVNYIDVCVFITALVLHDSLISKWYNPLLGHLKSNRCYTLSGHLTLRYGCLDVLFSCKGSGWNILIPLAVSQHNLYDIYLLLYIQY